MENTFIPFAKDPNEEELRKKLFALTKSYKTVIPVKSLKDILSKDEYDRVIKQIDEIMFGHEVYDYDTLLSPEELGIQVANYDEECGILYCGAEIPKANDGIVVRADSDSTVSAHELHNDVIQNDVPTITIPAFHMDNLSESKIARLPDGRIYDAVEHSTPSLKDLILYNIKRLNYYKKEDIISELKEIIEELEKE